MSEDLDKVEHKRSKLRPCGVCGINPDGHRKVFKIKISDGMNTWKTLCEKCAVDRGYRFEKGEVFVK